MSTNAFHEEMLPLSHRLRGYCLRLCKNPTAAEDLLQEAFLRAYLNIEKYKERTNAWGWLKTLTFRLFLNQKRHGEVNPGEWYDLCVREPRDPELLYLDREVLGVFHECHQQVLTLYGDAWYRKDVLGQSLKEIAADTGAPFGSVCSRSARGRTLLKSLLPKALDHNGYGP